MRVNGSKLGTASIQFGIAASVIAFFAILMFQVVAGGSIEDRTGTPTLVTHSR